MRSHPMELQAAREKLVQALGEQGCIDAACVAAFFACISRIVDATGLPVRPPPRVRAALPPSAAPLAALLPPSEADARLR